MLAEGACVAVDPPALQHVPTCSLECRYYGDGFDVLGRVCEAYLCLLALQCCPVREPEAVGSRLWGAHRWQSCCAHE